MGLTSFLVSIATAFLPNPLLTWAPVLQPPFFSVLFEHCSPCNLSKTHLQVCDSPIQKLFNNFLLENPTSQILYNFVLAPGYALMSSTYLTHHPTKSNCTLCQNISSTFHLHASPCHAFCLECSSSISAYRNSIFKTQKPCFPQSSQMEGVPSPPWIPTRFACVTLVSSIRHCHILQEFVWTPLFSSPFCNRLMQDYILFTEDSEKSPGLGVGKPEL